LFHKNLRESDWLAERRPTCLFAACHSFHYHKTSALLFTSQELRVCVHVHGRQRDLKPDPVCAVDSIREHVTVESGHVVWWDMLVFMNSFVNARQLCLTTWCKVDHWGRLVSLLDSTDCGEETGESV